MFGSMIKEALEGEGSRLLGAPVRVAAVSLSPFSGLLTIEGFGVGSPEALRVAKLTARTQLSNPLALSEVVADGVTINLDVRRGGSNLLRLKRGMSAEGPGITMESLLVRGGAVQAELFGRKAAFALPELRLERVDMPGLFLALSSAALRAARARLPSIRSMPRTRKRALKKTF